MALFASFLKTYPPFILLEQSYLNSGWFAPFFTFYVCPSTVLHHPQYLKVTDQVDPYQRNLYTKQTSSLLISKLLVINSYTRPFSSR